MQVGRATSVSISLSSSPLGFFSGSTYCMSMFSLTLLFIEFRVLRRSTPYYTCPPGYRGISSTASRPPAARFPSFTFQPFVSASWRTIASPNPVPPVTCEREASSR